MERLKISFDFDGTLAQSWLQQLAIILMEKAEIWICTSRAPGFDSSGNQELYKVATSIGIPEERVLFTDGAFKYETLASNNINIHFDDMEDEILEINTRTVCKGILVNLSDLEMLNYLFIEDKKIQNSNNV